MYHSFMMCGSAAMLATLCAGIAVVLCLVSLFAARRGKKGAKVIGLAGLLFATAPLVIGYWGKAGKERVAAELRDLATVEGQDASFWMKSAAEELEFGNACVSFGLTTGTVTTLMALVTLALSFVWLGRATKS